MKQFLFRRKQKKYLAELKIGDQVRLMNDMTGEVTDLTEDTMEILSDGHYREYMKPALKEILK